MMRFQQLEVASDTTPLETNMTLESPHFQWEMHLQIVDVFIVVLVLGGVPSRKLRYPTS